MCWPQCALHVSQQGTAAHSCSLDSPPAAGKPQTHPARRPGAPTAGRPAACPGRCSCSPPTCLQGVEGSAHTAQRVSAQHVTRHTHAAQRTGPARQAPSPTFLRASAQSLGRPLPRAAPGSCPGSRRHQQHWPGRTRRARPTGTAPRPPVCVRGGGNGWWVAGRREQAVRLRHTQHTHVCEGRLHVAAAAAVAPALLIACRCRWRGCSWRRGVRHCAHCGLLLLLPAAG